MYWEAGGGGDVVDEPRVDTGPVHLRVGGGSLDDDGLNTHLFPQSPELFGNNLGSLSSLSPPSSSLRLDFVEYKVGSN